MIVFEKRFVRIGELWFGEGPGTERVDVLKYRQSPTRPPRGRVSEFHTLVIDLGLSEAEIRSGFNKGTDYEARRAETKDGLVTATVDLSSPGTLDAYIAFYNAFTSSKGLPPAEPRTLAAYASASALVIREVRIAGELLVLHAYLMREGRTRLLQSASHFREVEDGSIRGLVGRANRFLHWDDLRYFKASGCSLYDFGGWYEGSEDEEKLNINRFKEGFGGRIVREYNATVPASPRGALYLSAVRAARGLGL